MSAPNTTNSMLNGLVKTEPNEHSPSSPHTEIYSNSIPFVNSDANTEGSQVQLSPSHKLAMTGSQCAVCGDVSSVEGGFRRHYGVICCEACKCFFRRTVQMSRDYKCRFGGRCAVGRTAVNLKQVCQACRFNQCIKAGMKLDSVKKFPRKVRDESSSKKSKKSKLSKDRHQPSDTSVPPTSNGSNSTKESQSAASPHSGKSESDIDELSQLKFNVTSPETLMYLENANVPQLFNYDSLENIHRDSGGSPSTKVGETNSEQQLKTDSILIRSDSLSTLVGLAKPISITTAPEGSTGEPVAGLILRPQADKEQQQFFLPQGSVLSPGNWAMKKGLNPISINPGVIHGVDHLSIPGGHPSFAPPTSPAKRPRIESTGSAIDMMSYHSSPGSQYQVGASHSAPHTPLPYSSSQPSSRVNSPDPGMSSVYNSHNNTPYATPSHSPLPSPPHTTHFFPPHSAGKNFTFDPRTNHSGAPSSVMNSPRFMSTQSSSNTVSQLTLPGFSPSNNLLALQQPSGSAILLNAQPQMPFGVGPLLPLVQFANPFSPPTLALNEHHKLQQRMQQMQQAVSQNQRCSHAATDERNGLESCAGKSPFSIVPIPSINKTQPPEEPECPEVSQISQDAESLCANEGMMSAPPSARSSPVSGKSKSRATLPEANVEEVLDSLRLRIRSMFKWAKSEAAGFDDLSPLDQKALLRKTVAELVMLGFARGSIAYENMLLLGSTGAVILPSNPNTGIASVASMTLQKLVVPLKVLNISDRELRLLKEVVLFNPEANGLRNREIVRQYRKRKHIELMEYTEKHSDDPGRFGELMCLLTPLFEVGLEVTEQLRLEQFVHEGEARIDALLLMSMISGAEEMPAESTIDQ